MLPQAIEWMLSVAAATTFRISSDNLLAADNLIAEEGGFSSAVAAQVQRYRETALPPRAGQFLLALAQFYGVADPLAAKHYAGLGL